MGVRFFNGLQHFCEVGLIGGDHLGGHDLPLALQPAGELGGYVCRVGVGDAVDDRAPGQLLFQRPVGQLSAFPLDGGSEGEEEVVLPGHLPVLGGQGEHGQGRLPEGPGGGCAGVVVQAAQDGGTVGVCQGFRQAGVIVGAGPVQLHRIGHTVQLDGGTLQQGVLRTGVDRFRNRVILGQVDAQAEGGTVRRGGCGGAGGAGAAAVEGAAGEGGTEDGQGEKEGEGFSHGGFLLKCGQSLSLLFMIPKKRGKCDGFRK